MSKIVLGYRVEEVQSEVPSLQHVSPGKYLCQVQEMGDFPNWDRDKTTASLERRIAIKLQFVDCPAHVAREDVLGRAITDFISKKATVAFRVKQFTDAAAGHGVTGDELDTDMFIGKMVVVDFKDDTYVKDGVQQTNSKVARYYPGTDWNVGKASTAAAAPTPGPVTASSTAAPQQGTPAAQPAAAPSTPNLDDGTKVSVDALL